MPQICDQPSEQAIELLGDVTEANCRLGEEMFTPGSSTRRLNAITAEARAANAALAAYIARIERTAGGN